jgi:hypothetical protein
MNEKHVGFMAWMRLLEQAVSCRSELKIIKETQKGRQNDQSEFRNRGDFVMDLAIKSEKFKQKISSIWLRWLPWQYNTFNSTVGWYCNTKYILIRIFCNILYMTLRKPGVRADLILGLLRSISNFAGSYFEIYIQRNSETLSVYSKYSVDGWKVRRMRLTLQLT